MCAERLRRGAAGSCSRRWRGGRVRQAVPTGGAPGWRPRYRRRTRASGSCYRGQPVCQLGARLRLDRTHETHHHIVQHAGLRLGEARAAPPTKRSVMRVSISMRRASMPLASAASSSSMIGRVCMPSPAATSLKRRRQCRGNGEQRLAPSSAERELDLEPKSEWCVKTRRPVLAVLRWAHPASLAPPCGQRDSRRRIEIARWIRPQSVTGENV